MVNPSWSVCCDSWVLADVTFTVVAGDWPPSRRGTLQPNRIPASTTAAPARTYPIAATPLTAAPDTGRASARPEPDGDRDPPGNGPGDGASGAAPTGARVAVGLGGRGAGRGPDISLRGAGAGTWRPAPIVGASGEPGY